MRGIVVGFVLAVIAMPALAQTQQQYDLCYSATASDDETIEGCTALIASGRYSGPDLSHAYNNRSFGYIDKHQFDLALADINMAIQLDPTNASAYNNRCTANIYKSLYAQAIADCSQAIALQRGYVNAFDNRGLAYERSGRSDLAISDYRSALQYGANDAMALGGLKRLNASP
jgi:tetratricopeptide (TPR) repeat protein